MDNQIRNRLATAGAVLVLVSVVVHLFGGVLELAAVASGDGTPVYAVLMPLGAILPLLLYSGYRSGLFAPLEVYTFGCGLMLLYLYAYADVHAIGTLESATGLEIHGSGHDHNGHSHDHNGDGHSHDHNGDGHSHDHNGDEHSHDHDDDSTFGIVVDHLREDTAALISKSAEAGAAILFGALSVVELSNDRS
ncbi:hypothetical protein OB955_18235 [Halobacteria archaeon AArc-m2/3/4]|uniref:Uncharacterized protein n=1 Tax=Natronoglomus mannanivorans TaxID=2979990 RepID=A0ABT2QIC4_9EURY|nr:hypothetical protein [Halobacteria archaeon AArc-m2/3/4]